MAATLHINMLSGPKGPEGQLTKEQADKVIELVQQLSEEWDSFILNKLSPTNYIITWENQESPIDGIYINDDGCISVWFASATDWKYYKDTVGLWGYLAPFGQMFLREWREKI